MRTTLPAVPVLLAALALAAPLAGCAYRLEGKVVEGFAAAYVGQPGDPDAQKAGVPGAAIELIRDPDRPTRARAGQATADRNGRFTLVVDGFGAGWLEEKWELRVRRNGYEGVQTELDLPASADGRMLFVTMPRGRAKQFADPESRRGLVDEARQYEPGVGGTIR